jgi:hypothetical protein
VTHEPVEIRRLDALGVVAAELRRQMIPSRASVRRSSALKPSNSP